MFVSVKFHDRDTRTYTYAYHGDDPIEPGQSVYVETKDGKKVVTVCSVDIEEPAFACKPIIGHVPQNDDAIPYENEGVAK